MTKRVFVYEYLSGGGWSDYGDDSAADELLPLGLSMRDAMVADLVRAADCSVSAAVCEPGNTLPRGVVPVRARTNESAFDFVARQSVLHDLVWLVAPETGGLLARFQRIVGNARWLGCSAEAIELTAGKKATLAHLAAHGVQTPLAFANAPEIARWVVKPDDGAGGVATHVHARHADALEDQALRTHAGATLTLEPWIDGEALSVSLLCTAQNAEMLSINRQSISIDATGRLSFDGVHVDAAGHGDPRWRPLAALAAQVAHAVPGLHGFAGIDLVWHPQRGPVVIEVNPRVTCAYVGLSAALGRNLAAELLAGRQHGGSAHEQELARADA
ncbi:ATP-grasp domain-containing protein [Variovorax paradoxus]|uniref:ATP-grasp domain-containing protein n=1 Tax=Variovorax paradoxus TaxID=34073 RepID=UPI002780155E|nr:ATP-grasp domain-containing protein [Variovorax paradoxus]MDQ0590695.1 putative ATP-grasp superfamily ATP-dependent carboligase [Variovorax paradoxus]